MLKTVVDEICRQEMAKASAQFLRLLQARPLGIAHTLHRGTEAQYLHQIRRLPCLKNVRFAHLYHMRDQIESQVSRRESALMAHEDALTRQAWRYFNAKDRQADYELYYELVHTFGFGLMTQESFDQTSRPGHQYYDIMSKSARAFQLMWRRWWPFRRRRKAKGARFLQTMWRAYLARRRWRPIILLRVKYGYRAQLKYRFKQWSSNAQVSVGVRKGYKRCQRGLKAAVFTAWSCYLQQKKRDREEKINKVKLHAFHSQAKKICDEWRKWTLDCVRVRRNFVRLYKNPYLSRWMQYMQIVRHEKREQGLALTCQRLGRGKLSAYP